MMEESPFPEASCTTEVSDEGYFSTDHGTARVRPVFERKIPAGDDRERLVCGTCGFIVYDNPRIIVGAVCTWEDRVLLARRAIEPRRGYWTVPAGFMELRETTEEGAAREVREETGARVRIVDLLALYNLTHISQVHLIYRAEMMDPHHAPGQESLETALVAWSDIPWDDLAYPTVSWALRDHAQRIGLSNFAPAGRPD